LEYCAWRSHLAGAVWIPADTHRLGKLVSAQVGRAKVSEDRLRKVAITARQSPVPVAAFPLSGDLFALLVWAAFPWVCFVSFQERHDIRNVPKPSWQRTCRLSPFWAKSGFAFK
jgi:hypothetical protein